MNTKKTILFVDDDAGVLDALRRALRGHHQIWDMRFALSVKDAMQMIGETPFDTIVTDINMPRQDGFELLALLRGSPETTDIPVIILTGNGDHEMKRRALDSGATDLLNKPVSREDLIARLRNVLKIKSYQDELKETNRLLEKRVQQRTKDLIQAREDIIWRLAKAGEHRDTDTGNHVVRVASCSRVLAEKLGLSTDFVDRLFLTSPLHDIGKIGIPDSILLKPDRLRNEEWGVMKQHCLIGSDILTEMPLGLSAFLDHTAHPRLHNRTPSSEAPLLQFAASIALYHHERWDGQGYPEGRRGQDIPIEARIVAIADVYDALSHARPYKNAFPEEQVISIMEQEATSHFDPEIYAAFLQIKDEFQSIKHDLKDQSEPGGARSVTDSAA